MQKFINTPQILFTYFSGGIARDSFYKKMAETVKKGDFIELEYTGTVKDDALVFDTTSADEAKKAGIHNPQAEYGPVIICLGEGQLLPGLDKALEGKEVQKEITADVASEDAFGKKSAELVQLIPLAKFKKENLQPQIGMQVNVDNQIGVVKTVGGGRVLVDFNHPLASKDVSYKVTIKRIITDPKEQAESYLKVLLGIKDLDMTLTDNKLTVKSKMEMPEPIVEQIKEKLKTAIPKIEDLKWEKQ